MESEVLKPNAYASKLEEVVVILEKKIVTKFIYSDKLNILFFAFWNKKEI